MPNSSPLGKPVTYTGHYDPGLLCPIERRRSREAMGVPAQLPFFGADVWNAYELSWLNERGQPQIAIATFYVPAHSPNIVESKSFKLYLGSFSSTQVASIDALGDTLKQDVSACVGATVSVQLTPPVGFGQLMLGELGGISLDRLDLNIEVYEPDASLLHAHFDQAPIDETVVSNLLKSNCPVTGQPDWGSVQIRYVGSPINHAGLLRYIVSYRNYADFHEQCVERMFMDIQQRCQPVKLAVYARYTRRGGLDINPFRASFNAPLPGNVRTARQ